MSDFSGGVGNRPDGPASGAESLANQIEHNIESVVALKRREWEQASPSQRRVERISRWLGRPSFLVGLLMFTALWIGLNLTLAALGATPLDPPPFQWLDDGLTLVALLMTIIVLIAQNRQSRLEQQHTHLGLQVNLLTEQKVTKLIHLIEELRRDLPMVKDRHDAQVAVLQRSPDTSEVLNALEEVGLTDTAKAPVKDPD